MSAALPGRAPALGVIAGIAISGAAIIVIGVMPIIAGIFAERFGLDLSQVGWVLSAESVGTAAGTALAYFLIPRGGWRLAILLGAALAASANLLCPLLARDFAALFGLRLLSGFGAGTVYAIVIFYLGTRPAPDRIFAGVVIVQGLCFSAYAGLLPQLAAAWGNDKAIDSIAAWFAAIALLSLFLPDRQAEAPASVSAGSAASSAPRGGLAGAAALIGLLCFQIGIFSFWGYAERLGAGRGLSADAVGADIALALTVGIGASLIPFAAGDRPGRVRMASLACALVLGGLALLAAIPTEAGFRWGLVLFNIGWPIGTTYFMALTAHHGQGGIPVRLIPAAQVSSGILGPAVVALVISGDRVLAANAVSAVFAAVAALLAWSTVRLGREE